MPRVGLNPAAEPWIFANSQHKNRQIASLSQYCLLPTMQRKYVFHICRSYTFFIHQLCQFNSVMTIYQPCNSNYNDMKSWHRLKFGICKYIHKLYIFSNVFLMYYWIYQRIYFLCFDKIYIIAFFVLSRRNTTYLPKQVIYAKYVYVYI